MGRYSHLRLEVQFCHLAIPGVWSELLRKIRTLCQIVACVPATYFRVFSPEVLCFAERPLIRAQWLAVVASERHKEVFTMGIC